MLRRAEEEDKIALLGYLSREPEFNLFLIADILRFGVRSEDVDVFMEGQGADIRAVLLRYRESCVVYTHLGNVDLSNIVERINKYLAASGRWEVFGKKEVVDRVKPGIRRAPSHERDQFFSVCRELKPSAPLDRLPLVEIATPADAREIGCLWGEEFGRKENPKLAGDIEAGWNRIAFIRDAGSRKIISVAAAVAESDSSAMIIGVETNPAHRRKGYASACVCHLVRELHERGKSACLFFHNPEAGTIYHRLGFADIGMWKMLEFNK